MALPTTFERSLASFDSDDLAQRTFGKDFHRTYVEYMSRECREYRSVVTDWETRTLPAADLTTMTTHTLPFALTENDRDQASRRRTPLRWNDCCPPNRFWWTSPRHEMSFPE